MRPVERGGAGSPSGGAATVAIAPTRESSAQQDLHLQGVALPGADHATIAPLGDVPVVSVAQREVRLDGRAVDDARVLDGERRLRRLDGLFAALRDRFTTWKASHPGEPPGGSSCSRSTPMRRATW